MIGRTRRTDLRNSSQLTPGLTLLLATTSGVSVANLYYAQPLLPNIARNFHTSSSKVAFVMTASQIGYALGLLFLLPLGDLMRRKPLIISAVFTGSAALALISMAKNLLLFEVMSLIIGLSSVVAQIVVPLAADLSPQGQSGKTVGTVMSGLLLGILLARTFAGIIADALGISAVFLIGAGIMAIMGLILVKMLPEVEAKRPDETINSILASTVRIFIQHRTLQLRGLYGMMSFVAFTMLWTSLSFYLAGPKFRYSPRTIGLFGLFGVAGALAARLTGNATDKGKARFTTGLGGILVVLGFLELHRFGSNLWFLAFGIVVLDGAVQAVHISNQSIIYKVLPSARSRINSSYMTMYFIGGGIGSALAGYAWQQGGWGATTLIGAASGAVIVAIWLMDRVSMKPVPADPKPPS